MAVIQISDVVVPEEFTAYQTENSLVSTAFFQCGVIVKNGFDRHTAPSWFGEFQHARF